MRRCGKRRPAVLTTAFLMSAVASGVWYSETAPKRPLRTAPNPFRPTPRRSRYSAAPCALTAAASASAPAAVPPCAFPAAGRLGAAFVRPTVFRGATAGADFLAALVWAVRFRPGLAAAGVAFPAALAFLAAAHRLFVAAMIRGRPSGIRRRFCLAACAGAGVAAAALAFRAALCHNLAIVASHLREALLLCESCSPL